MWHYIVHELPELVSDNFAIDRDAMGITGHSMGGHGALTIGLTFPDRFRAVSAFAPIVAPTQVPWGAALDRYLGDDMAAKRRHDAVALIEDGARLPALLVDQGDPVAFEAALALKPKLVLVETPSNPLLRLVDVADICTRAHAAGAKVVCDNTFLSPALQNPIKLGADFVVHSTTKFINGHSDVVGGAVISADAEDHQTLAWWANCTGVTGSPFDAYLTLRGVRTLFARIERIALGDHVPEPLRVD